MKVKKRDFIKVFCLTQVLMLGTLASYAQKKGKTTVFEKHTITSDFIAEGAAIGDVNKDGKKDILSGAYWFEAPNWTKHEIMPPKVFSWKDGYSDSFLNFSVDVNQDGWVDLIRIDIAAKPAVWYENPKNKSGHWTARQIYPSIGNESPLFVDIDGDGRLDLLANDPENKQVIWLSQPRKKGDFEWEKNIISSDPEIATHMYTHGLGYGDINGDGKPDVIVKNGWWEGTDHPKTKNWKFHAANLSQDCAQMYVYDVNKDGLNDVLSSSAHNYGIWWHEQGKDAQGNTTWTEHEISRDFSQSHGLGFKDVNGDGVPDLVTGKRWYAHNGGDPGAQDASLVYWYELKPGKNPTWIPHRIDTEAGAGLHVEIEDMNKDGLTDIVTGNKKGVHFFENHRK
ncbi:VCBS repeat-containing protein [Dyadobacter sp. LHD-138]|uniref:FG-GAP repeat domain-containing protein n=1 Tax=Dyadobacter sp. LHD-138 TaxID=3071413 RepID=UPI0027E08015|nr:VCBS repeat-containing protein [Dyadobacter sp. LHD-138]MDQ6478929.1 VCBS repeat-containing protein [Dyadobacter sp. LHD-138]